MRIDVEDTAQWRALHAGRITASMASIINHGGPRAWSSYLRRLRSEQATGQWGGGSMPATDWGIEHEDEARRLFAFETGLKVEAPPIWIEHHSMPELACSPDGLSAGGNPVEIKCPYNPDIHQQHRAGTPEEYYLQIMFQCWIMVASHGWFVSYDPRACNGAGSLVYRQHPRDNAVIQKLETRTRELREHLLNNTEPEVLDLTAGKLPTLF